MKRGVVLGVFLVAMVVVQLAVEWRSPVAWIPPVDAQSPCTHYASPTGSSGNTGTSQSSPFRPADFWAVATPGKVLCLMDGTYTGSAFLIRPGSIAGTSANPIIIRALNDGAVLIDGQGSTQPVFFNGTSFVTLQGINARNGHFGVLYFQNSTNVTVQRSIFWDTLNDTNDHVVEVVSGAQNTLLEDVAVFGNGRDRVLEWADNSTRAVSGTRYRRMWTRVDGYCTGGTVDFDALQYDYANVNTDGQVDNWIAYNNQWLMTQPGCNSTYNGNPNTLFGQRTPGIGTGNPGHKFAGLILFATPAPAVSGGSGIHSAFLVGNVASPNVLNGVNVVDSFMDMDAQPSAKTINLFPSTCQGQNSITRVTTTGAGGDGTGCATVTNLNHYASVSAANSAGSGLFAGATNSARPNLCFQYKDGQLTNTPLWPWPMDDRIKAALAIRGAPGLAGVAGTGGQTHAAGTVTSEIISRYGPIPSQCYGAGTPITPPPLTPFPTTPILDNFNRADGAPGANWTVLGTGGFVISSNALTPVDQTQFQLMRWTATFGADQEAYFRIAGLPTVGTAFEIIVRGQDISNRYVAFASSVTGANNDAITLNKEVGGVNTSLCAPGFNLGFDIAVGDSFGIRATGAFLEAWYQRAGQQWARIGYCNDTSFQSGGFIGIGHGDVGIIDDWGGGNIGTAPPGTSPPAAVQRPALTPCPGSMCPPAPARPSVP
jgi:hypothetical protein